MTGVTAQPNGIAREDAPLRAKLANRERLISLMQALHFGTIHNLKVRAGEPVLDPALRIVREIKFGSDTRPDYAPPSADRRPKSQVCELLELFGDMGNGVIEVLEVRHGLPFRVVIAAALTRLES